MIEITDEQCDIAMKAWQKQRMLNTFSNNLSYSFDKDAMMIALNEFTNSLTNDQLLAIIKERGLDKKLATENKNLLRKNKHFISLIKLREKQLEELRHKKFWKNERSDQYWIFMDDGTDNLATLICPVIIHGYELLSIIQERDDLRQQAQRTEES